MQPLNLSSNVRLQHLSFYGLHFNDAWVPTYILSTLHSVRRHSLQALVSTEPRFSTLVGLDVFFRELDGLLKDKALFDRLHSVCFYESCRGPPPGPAVSILQSDFKAKMEVWLPHLHQRGMLVVGKEP